MLEFEIFEFAPPHNVDVWNHRIDNPELDNDREYKDHPNESDSLVYQF